jgi:protein-tyrosine-phosphatase
VTIQFVCRGNALRSIIAEAYLRSLAIPHVTVLSSGTVASQSKAANAGNFLITSALLKRHNIAHYAKHGYAEDLTQSALDTSDIVVFVNKIFYDEAARLFRLPVRTYIWDVDDVGEKHRLAADIAQREALSEEVYKEIVKNIDDLVRRDV